MVAATHAPSAVLVLMLAALAWLLMYGPPLDPGIVRVGSPPHTNLQTDSTKDILDNPSYSRTTTTFPCSDATCEAWIYLPNRTTHPPPIVLMSNGFGGQKDFGIHRFASSFASAGLAAFVLDYRGWGGSGSGPSPRHWLSARRNLEDLRSALAHVRGQLAGEVDVSRLVLWGTSFSAGLALVLASQPDVTPHITAVVAQMPHLDPGHAVKASLASRGPGGSLRMLAAGLLDLARTALGGQPLYLPIAGPLGSLAFLQMDEEQLRHYHSNHPTVKQGGWQNVARAAYAAEHTFMRMRPIRHVASITAPVLFLGARRDTTCPLSVIEAAAAATPRSELFFVDADHFDFFSPAYLPQLLEVQAEFMWRHAGGPQQQQQQQQVPGKPQQAGDADAAATAAGAAGQAASTNAMNEPLSDELGM